MKHYWRGLLAAAVLAFAFFVATPATVSANQCGADHANYFINVLYSIGEPDWQDDTANWFNEFWPYVVNTCGYEDAWQLYFNGERWISAQLPDGSGCAYRHWGTCSWMLTIAFFQAGAPIW